MIKKLNFIKKFLFILITTSFFNFSIYSMEEGETLVQPPTQLPTLPEEPSYTWIPAIPTRTEIFTKEIPEQRPKFPPQEKLTNLNKKIERLDPIATKFEPDFRECQIILFQYQNQGFQGLVQPESNLRKKWKEFNDYQNLSGGQPIEWEIPETQITEEGPLSLEEEHDITLRYPLDPMLFPKKVEFLLKQVATRNLLIIQRLKRAIFHIINETNREGLEKGKALFETFISSNKFKWVPRSTLTTATIQGQIKGNSTSYKEAKKPSRYQKENIQIKFHLKNLLIQFIKDLLLNPYIKRTYKDELDELIRIIENDLKTE